MNWSRSKCNASSYWSFTNENALLKSIITGNGPYLRKILWSWRVQCCVIMFTSAAFLKAFTNDVCENCSAFHERWSVRFAETCIAARYSGGKNGVRELIRSIQWFAQSLISSFPHALIYSPNLPCFLLLEDGGSLLLRNVRNSVLNYRVTWMR